MIAAALAVRLGAALLTIVTARQRSAARAVAFLGSAAASVLTGLAAVRVLHAGVADSGTLFIHRASGFAFTYRLDALSAWFVGVLAVLAIPIAIFSIAYTARSHFSARSAFVGAGFNLLVGSLELIFVADSVVTFLFAWELCTLVTVGLVATEHEDRANRRAAGLYLVMSHIGAGCLTIAFLVLASRSGSWTFASILSGHVVAGPLRDGLFALFLIGFGVKAGIIPLHIWLPEAHPSAPSNVSALMSGVLIKAGIYGLVRVCAFGLGTPSLSWGVIIVSLGGISAVLGVLYALMQHDLKRLLAYHSIENIGIILLGLGAGMIAIASGRPDLAPLGICASLFHVLNHAVFKGLLFLGAGSVVTSTGTRQIEHYGGLLKLMPYTGLFFLIGAMAISGLPPLNGFASEWLTFQSFLFGFSGSSQPLVLFLSPVAGALLALTTALAAACFVKAFGITFLALPRSTEAAAAREMPWSMIAPQAALAILCVAFGLFPGAVLRVIGSVATSLPGMPFGAAMASADPMRLVSGTTTIGSFDHAVPFLLASALAAGLALAAFLAMRRAAEVRRVATWGCGGELTARTEYTATAFSKPLMMIFQAIYRPTRTVEALSKVSPYFPQEVRYRSEIEPTFERHVYGPVVNAVMRVARGMEVLQAGSLHAYLAYVIALVVSLVLFVWWRG